VGLKKFNLEDRLMATNRKFSDVRPVLINGRWQTAEESIEVRSPYSDDLLAMVASVSERGLSDAIAAAANAAREMRQLERYRIAFGLRLIADGIEQRKIEFTESIVAESAKPLRYARGEVERAIATFSHAAGEAERFGGEIVPVDTQPNGKGKTAYSMRVPKGVIYGITPFNFPLNLVAHKVAPALASRNAIIIKPSPRTPLTALLLGEVFQECGLPAAALQVVPMDTRHIERVIADDRVAMISFTGSAAVGWDLKQKASRKAVALELGGNAPVIVDHSADIASSVSKSVTGSFAYSGQVCISVQRVYVHNDIFQEWTDEFVNRARMLKVGDPSDENTELSIMIDEAAAARAEQWTNEAVSIGASRLCGSARRGKLLEATVLTGTDPEMRVVAEEVFAPVAVVERFFDFRDAIEMANHSKYGLQAGVFTGEVSNARYAAENLEYGGIIINDVPTFRVDNMPYGGLKGSGFGREGIRYAMEEMTDLKLVVTSK
jgi:glyceraldehyde-3-phosphate dehydrogenase (NADP+)